MTELAQVLFRDGFGTPLLFARWRAKGAARPLPPRMRLTENAKPTVAFENLWGVAFPTRASLPEIVHTPEGTPTVEFHQVFR